jgi:hypothetical protein
MKVMLTFQRRVTTSLSLCFYFIQSTVTSGSHTCEHVGAKRYTAIFLLVQTKRQFSTREHSKFQKIIELSRHFSLTPHFFSPLHNPILSGQKVHSLNSVSCGYSSWQTLLSDVCVCKNVPIFCDSVRSGIFMGSYTNHFMLENNSCIFVFFYFYFNHAYFPLPFFFIAHIDEALWAAGLIKKKKSNFFTSNHYIILIMVSFILQSLFFPMKNMLVYFAVTN